jgi:hypothetical protein
MFSDSKNTPSNTCKHRMKRISSQNKGVTLVPTVTMTDSVVADERGSVTCGNYEL